MRELTLILTDFYLDHDAAGDAAGWPQLPGLESVLARGEVNACADWRKWVCQRIGLQASGRIPIAALSRFAHAPAPAGHWWLAHCVHLEVGVDRVYLTGEFPELAMHEWRELERGFNEAFSATGFSLMDGQASHAYVMSDLDLEIDTIDPVRVRNLDILQALPAGAGAAPLRRLMTEIQMWLHDHPVNIARQDRGAVTVNGLWIWGNGPWPTGAPAAVLPELRGDDDFLDGLWKLGGGVAERLPLNLRAIDLGREEAMIVALASKPRAGESRAQALASLERDWFEPALSSVRRGETARLLLHVNDRLCVMTRLDAWRWWRKRHSWLERLS